MDELETILATAKERFNSGINGKQEEKLYNYLLTRLGKFQQRTPQIQSYLSDEVQMFSYLSRIAPVRNLQGTPTILNVREKLQLIRQKAQERSSWHDDCLFDLFKRCKNRKNTNLPDYKRLIDDVGKTPQIIDIWGKPIIYEKDVDTQKKHQTTYIIAKTAKVTGSRNFKKGLIE